MDQEKLIQQLKELIRILEEKAAKIRKVLRVKKESDEWLTSAEVKSILKISESTLRRMRRRDEIPYRKIGRTYYYSSTFFEVPPSVAIKGKS